MYASRELTDEEEKALEKAEYFTLDCYRDISFNASILIAFCGAMMAVHFTILSLLSIKIDLYNIAPFGLFILASLVLLICLYPRYKIQEITSFIDSEEELLKDFSFKIRAVKIAYILIASGLVYVASYVSYFLIKELN